MIEIKRLVFPDVDFKYYGRPNIQNNGHIYCIKCGCRKAEWDRPYSDRPLKKLNRNIMVSYDGVVLVSSRFRDFLQAEADAALRFHEFRPGVFQLTCLDQLKSDLERVKPLRQERFCDHCGEHQVDLVLGHNFYTNPEILKANGLYFSETTWGTCPNKSHQVFAGHALARKLAAEFKEVYLHDYTYCGPDDPIPKEWQDWLDARERAGGKLKPLFSMDKTKGSA